MIIHGQIKLQAHWGGQVGMECEPDTWVVGKAKYDQTWPNSKQIAREGFFVVSGSEYCVE